MNIHLKLNTNTLFFIPVAVALIIRVAYHLLGIEDFWGDAYHNVLISSGTIDNQWVYWDYKGREVVWLPFYRYFISFFMLLTGSRDILVPHLVNMILGAISCGLVATITARLASIHHGLMAGVLLAILPWHVAYSHMNMPELIGSVILLSAVFSSLINQWVWMIPLGLLGALTKNELSLYLGILGVILIAQQRWKMVFALASGGAVALIWWGVWNYNQTGHFFWWISERSVGSGWDKVFYFSRGSASGAWWIPFLSIIQVFPLSLLMLIPQFWAKFKRLKKDDHLFVVTVLVLFNWVFVTLMNLGYFPSPDARYFIITLPLAAVSFMVWSHRFDLHKKWSYGFLTIILGISFFQWSGFYFLQFTLYSEVEIGKHLKERSIASDGVWIDLPTSVYFGELSYDKVFSSELIAPKDQRSNRDHKNEVASRIRVYQIKWIVFQDVPYSYLGTFFSVMKKNEPFSWKGIRFDPVHSVAYEADGATLWERLKVYAAADRSASLWRLSYKR